MGAKSAEKAADTQADAAREATAAQKEMYQQGRSDIAPWRISGVNALMAMSDMMGLKRPALSQINGPGTVGGNSGGMSVQPAMQGQNRAYPSGEDQGSLDYDIRARYGGDYSGNRMPGLPELNQYLNPAGPPSPTGYMNVLNQTNNAKPPEGQYDKSINMPHYNWKTSPGYDWRLNEGRRAIDTSAAARGSVFSGATLKALDRYGQGVASDEYGNVYNRLGVIAGFGPGAANNSANMAMQTGQQIGQNALAAGNARASGYINQANAYSGMSKGIVNALLSYYGQGGGGGWGSGAGAGGIAATDAIAANDSWFSSLWK
jgi:hypothetical protein